MKSSKSIFSVLGSLKAAVTLVFLLALILAIATFIESRFNERFAHSLVYGSLWFQLLLFLLGLNILAAAIVRLPPKKALMGFYLSHLGLLLILIGSFLTLLYGIDGAMTLAPGRTTYTVELKNNPALFARYADGKKFQVALPKGALQTEMHQPILTRPADKPILTLRRYLPYAKESTTFQETMGLATSGMKFRIHSPMAETQSVLSSPPSDYPQDLNLGPLQIFFLGEIPGACEFPLTVPEFKWFMISASNCSLFQTPPPDGLLVETERRLRPLRLLSSREVFQLDSPSLSEMLIPSVSAWPLDQRMKPRMSSMNRLYAVSDLFAKDHRVVVFIQGQVVKLAVFRQDRQTVLHTLDLKKANSHEIELPWMGFHFQIEEINKNALPYRSYETDTPHASEDVSLSALALEANHNIYWITNKGESTQVPLSNGDSMQAYLSDQTINVPWGFELRRFQMGHDPGTKNPSHYESFLSVYDPANQMVEDAHIYMNNPLKKGRYTFYQASYFSAGPNSFGSILQVNYDPGRPFKYSGSGFLVAGTTLHFYLRRKRNARSV